MVSDPWLSSLGDNGAVGTLGEPECTGSVLKETAAIQLQRIVILNAQYYQIF